VKENPGEIGLRTKGDASRALHGESKRGGGSTKNIITSGGKQSGYLKEAPKGWAFRSSFIQNKRGIRVWARTVIENDAQPTLRGKKSSQAGLRPRSIKPRRGEIGNSSLWENSENPHGTLINPQTA